MSNEKEKHIPSLKELVKMNEELLKIINDLKKRIEKIESSSPLTYSNNSNSKPKIVLKED
jgi:hypothetical protein